MIPHCHCQGSRSEDSREGVEKPFGDAENEITSEWWAFRRMDQSPGGEMRVFNVAACPVFCLQTHRPAM